MLYNHSSYDDALVPPRENRFAPDDTEIVETTANDELVTLAEAKAFLPVPHNESDTYLQKIIDGVTRQVENYIQRDILKKNRRSYWLRMPPKARLPFGPHGSITEVKVVTKEGEETVLTEGDDFYITGMQWKTLIKIEHHVGEFFVKYESGYAPDKRPPEVIGAIQQEISLQYKNRQDPDTPGMTSVNNLSLEARHLLNSLFPRAY